MTTIILLWIAGMVLLFWQAAPLYKRRIGWHKKLALTLAIIVWPFTIPVIALWWYRPLGGW